MLAIIFNYNMPEKALEHREKLLLDGFLPENIIEVDNGSELDKRSESANFVLPFNVRFTGQAYITLTYLLDFSECDDFLLITTSCTLEPEINYLSSFVEAKQKLDGNYGFVTSALTGGAVETSCPEQKYDKNSETKFAQSFTYQPIVTLVSRELLKYCRDAKAAYFNLGLRRGWGIDRELQYIANRNGLYCAIARQVYVTWETNALHKAGLADETRSSYHNHAESEMQKVFSKRYGLAWEEMFRAEFSLQAGTEPSKRDILSLRLKSLAKTIISRLGILRLIRSI